MSTLLAHQGGWDEIVLVAGPLLVFAAVLYLANRRANQKLAAAAPTTGDDHTENTETSRAETLAGDDHTDSTETSRAETLAGDDPGVDEAAEAP